MKIKVKRDFYDRSADLALRKKGEGSGRVRAESRWTDRQGLCRRGQAQAK